jgi:aminoglycoside phosphotransferase family enzyme
MWVKPARDAAARIKGMDDTAALVDRLARRLRAEVLETHISWVLLAGPLAYKLKKPLRLPVLDYSTLEQRRHFCAEEVRLNQRFAPGLYLGVSAVTGPAQAPGIDGEGPVLDYAVRMRRFPAGALFSEQLARGTLTTDAVDRLGRRLAALHASAPVAPPLQAGGQAQPG